MANPSKAKGTEWEMRVLRFLASYGLDVQRMPPAGSLDVGDLQLTDKDGDRWVLECKATKALDLAGGMNELAAEQKRAGVPFGACVFKRRNHDTSRGYVVMELADFAALISPEVF